MTEKLNERIEKARLSRDGKNLFLEMVFEDKMAGEKLKALEEEYLNEMPELSSVEIRPIYVEKAPEVVNHQGENKAAGGAVTAKKSQYSAAGEKGYPKRNSRSPKTVNAEGKVICGKAIGEGERIVEISGLEEGDGKVVIRGSVVKSESRGTKNGKGMAMFAVYDGTSTMPVKTFLNTPEDAALLAKILKEGSFVKLRGELRFDSFENNISLIADDIERSEKPEGRKDTYEGKKRVELHIHSKMSAMDGLNAPETIVKRAAEWGQRAVAVTDHGVVQAFPDMAAAAKAIKKEKDIDIKIIYGLEGYLYDDSGMIAEDGSINYRDHGTYHIILLAKTQEGIKNLYKLVSYSHIDYFYKKPRLPRSVIEAHREGLIIGSACEAGELYQAVLSGASDEKLDEIASYYDYLEIQPLVNNRFLVRNGRLESDEDLKNINRKIIEVGRRLGKLTCATTDSHYTEPGDALYRNILFAGQGYKDAEEGEGLYMRTTAEMLEEFSYLGEELAYEVVVENTNAIADEIEELLPVPKEKCPPKIDGAEEQLRKSCMDKAHEMYGEVLPEQIEARLNKELDSIIGNGYAVMYVLAQMIVNNSVENGYLVGSRGSVGSSLAATMAGITEINPMPPHYLCPSCKHVDWGDELFEKGMYDCGADMPDRVCPVCGENMRKEGFTIPFETFLGFDGDKEPDIDLNIAGDYQARSHKYVGEIFGEENVFKAGTVGTVKDKTAFGFVKKYYEAKGGAMPNKYEIERLAHGCEGVKRTTGQHPGGIIILPKGREIYEFCPVQHPANKAESGVITTHYDYHKIDANLLKLDLLGHDIPSMLRQLQDLTGVDPMGIPLDDKDVMSIFTGTEALGIKVDDYKFSHGSFAIPEFGTRFVRQMLDDTKPSKIADLVRIAGFSHGTDVWLGNAQEYIRSGVANMTEVISTRDDIMNYLILKGLPNKDSFTIMEKVRKGKGLTEEQIALMKENDVPEWYIDSCLKIKYMFPRAHAAAYTLMSFRLAWYKVHYPAEFYAAFLSTKVTDFDAATALAGIDAVWAKLEDYEARGMKLSAKEENEVTVLEILYEMMARGIVCEAASFGKSKAMQFDIAGEGEEKRLILPFGAMYGVGDVAAQSIYDAFGDAPFESVDDLVARTGINKTAVQALRDFGVLKGLPETSQLSFF